ncbi:MAG: prepilin-type N-terminal cleavage/methylation domain-containing protein [Puniceicoccaceae bacterium]|nr:MAG: prepilin-type N-terminal cleavage/methylation domain-containing protein [Puniceicoccaceae bacterium]
MTPVPSAGPLHWCRPARPAPVRGFTLVEIILVVAMIGLFVSLLVVNYETLLRRGPMQTVEETFWRATREARQRALFQRQPQRVVFDEEAHAFIIRSPGGDRNFRLDRGRWPADMEAEVTFFQDLPEDGYRLIRGELVRQRPIPQVVFYPDGSCTPFEVRLEVGDSSRSIRIDPWTGAELLPEERRRW